MDYIITATDDAREISINVAKTTNMVETMRVFHNTTPVVCAAIGRAMTATSIMGSMMKGQKNKLTTIVKGNGPIGNITCVAKSNGYVKACATNYDVDIPIRNTDSKLDVGTAVGNNGVLTVIKDLGLKEPYIGHNPLVNGEIAEDFTSYFFNSEQTLSSVGLGVLVDVDYSVKHSGGFIASLLPFATEEKINILEKNINNIKSVTNMMSLGYSPEKIAQVLLDGLGCHILSKKEIKYECDCSDKRMKESLSSLGKKELSEIYDADKTIEICCHFCNKKYFFNEDEFLEIINNL